MPSVYQAISAVMHDLPAIEKNDRGEGVSYKFRGIETLVGHLQPILARHGVIIVPTSTLVTKDEVTSAKSGNLQPGWWDIVLRVEWRIYGPDGDFIEAATYGIGRDNSDKGSNKAQTQAFKYLLMELFCIGDKEDDGDGHPQADADVPSQSPGGRAGSAAARGTGPRQAPSGPPVDRARETAQRPAGPPSTPSAPTTPPERAREEVELSRDVQVRLAELRHASNKNDAALNVELVRVVRTHANDRAVAGEVKIGGLYEMVADDATWAVIREHFLGETS